MTTEASHLLRRGGPNPLAGWTPPDQDARRRRARALPVSTGASALSIPAGPLSPVARVPLALTALRERRTVLLRCLVAMAGLTVPVALVPTGVHLVYGTHLPAVMGK